MPFLSKATVLAAAVAGLLTAPASAAVLIPNVGPEFGNWTRFLFNDVGSPITDALTGDASWTVTLVTPGFLHVTDAFIIGDQWEIFVDGGSIGVTGPFDTTGAFTDDPNDAFGGAVYSWLSYALAPGTYVIEGTTTASPVGSGGSFIRVVSGVVPEPASWAMLIAGFGLVGSGLRRRRAALAA